MNNALITVISRFVQVVPLVLIIIPLLKSYLEKINKINGLRRTRVILLFFFFSILAENIFFIYYAVRSLLSGDNSVIPDVNILILDRIMNAIAYFLLYYLFTHARKHNDGASEKNQQI